MTKLLVKWFVRDYRNTDDPKVRAAYGKLGGIVGILVMPLVGAFIGEFWAKRDLLHAGRVGIATWIGMIVGTAVKVALAFMMLGILVVVLLV